MWKNLPHSTFYSHVILKSVITLPPSEVSITYKTKQHIKSKSFLLAPWKNVSSLTRLFIKQALLMFLSMVLSEHLHSNEAGTTCCLTRHWVQLCWAQALPRAARTAQKFLVSLPIIQGWYQTNCWALPASRDAKGSSLIKVTAGQREMVKPSASIMSALLSPL